jgi:hypothetical protein
MYNFYVHTGDISMFILYNLNNKCITCSVLMKDTAELVSWGAREL